MVSNKGAPGVDKMTVSDFPEFAQENWERIRAAILDDSYQPKPTIHLSGSATYLRSGILRSKLRFQARKVSSWRREENTGIYLPGISHRDRHGLVQILRQGYWHLSRTLATQTGMTNKWIKD